MTVVKWTPFQELDSIERRVRRAFEDVGLAPTLVPAADVYETADEFVVELEVPGLEESEIAVELTDHTLTVRGAPHARETEGRTFRLRERLERGFERCFELPRTVDTKHVRATFERGVLEVHARKTPVPTARRVPIGTQAKP